MNDFWVVENGVEDFTIRGKVSDQLTDDGPLFFNKPLVLCACQNWQCWGAFFREVVFVRIICRGASRHEMFLDDVDGGLGWILWLRLCSPVARSMYPTSLVEEKFQGCSRGSVI